MQPRLAGSKQTDTEPVSRRGSNRAGRRHEWDLPLGNHPASGGDRRGAVAPGRTGLQTERDTGPCHGLQTSLDRRTVHLTAARPNSVVTIFVDHRDAHVAAIAARGLKPDERETYSNGVRKALYRDPDGNELGFGGAPLDTGSWA